MHCSHPSSRLFVLLITLFVLLISVPESARVLIPDGDVPTQSTAGIAANSEHFELIGHHPLFNRGMNAALAIYDHFVYIGNRTDGSATCGVGDPRGRGSSCPHPHPGVLILDIADPTRPQIVGEIGPPFEGNVGITSRELRVWPQQKLLMVMNFRCSPTLHACPQGTDVIFPFDIKFFDLSDPLHPRFLSSYIPTSKAGQALKPHEMFLWVDPKLANRGLLYLSTPTITANPTVPNLLIVDISRVSSGGQAALVAQGNWNNRYPGSTNPANYNFDLSLHSMGVTADGTQAYLAMEAGQFLILDTSDIADNTSNPQLRLLTDPINRPIWGNGAPCAKFCPNGHSAVEVPGRKLALTTDEVYGTFTDRSHGCPWAGARLIDVADPTRPKIMGAYKLTQNELAFCGSTGNDPQTEQFSSFSSHNPTVLGHLALISWHSGGLQALDIANPANIRQAGWFSPTPLGQVANEDPALSRGPNKIVMWSYPVLRNGLIYVVDIRNGLFILRYNGPHQNEVKYVNFLEGNSNLGAALTPGRAEPDGKHSPPR